MITDKKPGIGDHKRSECDEKRNKGCTLKAGDTRVGKLRRFKGACLVTCRHFWNPITVKTKSRYRVPYTLHLGATQPNEKNVPHLEPKGKSAGDQIDQHLYTLVVPLEPSAGRFGPGSNLNVVPNPFILSVEESLSPDINVTAKTR